MFNFVKKIVAGPKRMLQVQGKELDLTYISERIIAMAFPACSTLEKIYRNSIEDVAEYLNSQHNGQYLIINVSNRVYDYSKFGEKVKDFQWFDHQAPALSTLIHIAYQMQCFLKKHQDGVVAIHCNHGKGRTGTSIISFMLLIGYIHSADICLRLYNSKRFSSQDYGVDQPCQLRYLRYIQELVRQPKIIKKLPFYSLNKITYSGGLTDKYFIKMTNTRSQEVVLDNVQFNQEIVLSKWENMLYGDLFIQLFREGKVRERKKISRINVNLYFLNQNSMVLTFSSKEIKIQRNDVEEFTITFHFNYFCLCHLKAYQNTKCQCSLIRVAEEMFWDQMIAEIKECKKLTPQEIHSLVHGGNINQEEELFKFEQQTYNHSQVPLLISQKRRKNSLPVQMREQKLKRRMIKERQSMRQHLSVQEQQQGVNYKQSGESVPLQKNRSTVDSDEPK